MESRGHLRVGRGVAGGQGGLRRRAAHAGKIQGTVDVDRGLAGRWSGPPVRPRQGAVAALRLREHGSGSGHARQPARGHAAGDDAAGRDVRRAGRLHRAGGPESREGRGRAVPCLGAAPEGVPRLPRRHPAPRGAHAHRQRREAPRRRRPAGPGTIGHVQHPVERGLSVSVRDAERRPVGEARPGRVQRSARAAEPRGSREGDGGVLRRARRLQPDVRDDDERRSAEGGVLHQGAQVPIRRSRRLWTAPTFRHRSTRG